MNINNTILNYNLLNNMNIQTRNLNKLMTQLSTGKRINSASDSPSEILRLSKQKSQLSSLTVAQRNITDGISLIETANNSLTIIEEMGNRLKELSVQYKNETLSDEDRVAIKAETQALLKEMKHISDNTTFNGVKVFEKDSITIQTGINSGDTYNIKTSISNNKIEVKSSNNTISLANFNTGKAIKAYSNSNALNTNGRIIDNYDNESVSLSNAFVTDVYIKDFEYNGYLITGNHADGKLNGYSTIVNKETNELVFAGDFVDNNYEGYISVTADNVTYSGTFSNGKINGYGTISEKLEDGTTVTYAGEFIDGMKNGVGSLAITDKDGNTTYTQEIFTNDVSSSGIKYETPDLPRYPFGDYYDNGTSNSSNPGNGSGDINNGVNGDNSSNGSDNNINNGTNNGNDNTNNDNNIGDNNGNINGGNNGTVNDGNDNTVNGDGNAGGNTPSIPDDTVDETLKPNNPNDNITIDKPNGDNGVSEPDNGVNKPDNNDVIQKPSVDIDEIDEFLNSDRIDTDILNPVRELMTSLGISQSILEKRYELNSANEITSSNNLEAIESVDIAKTLLEKTKNELLLQTTTSLLAQSMDLNRNNILYLLQ